MKKSGFTLIELILSLTMMTILTATVIFTSMAGLRAWDTGRKHSAVRDQLANAVELIVKDLRRAATVDGLTASSVTFTADLGDGEPKQYRFHVYQPEGETAYKLLRGLSSDEEGQGALIAANIRSTETDWFSQSGNVITLTLTASDQGETVRMRTSVRPRNL